MNAKPSLRLQHLLELFILFILFQGGGTLLHPLLKQFSELFAITLTTFAFVSYLFFRGFQGLLYDDKLLYHLKQTFLFSLVAFPIVFALNFSLSFLAFYFSKGVPPDQIAIQFLKSLRHFPSLFFLTIAAIIFLVPFIEELLFRGFIQSYARRFMGPYSAIFVSSSLFTLFHFSPAQEWSNLAILPPLFVLSLFISFIYQKMGSLWAPYGLHSLFNATSLFLLLFENGYPK